MKDKTYLEGLAGIAHGDTTGSVFDADEWSLYDWSMMLDAYPNLEQLIGAAAKAGVDGREAFFALSGHEVTGDGPKAEGWKALLANPAWKRAREQARTRHDKAAILTSLLRQMGRRSLDEQDQDQDQDQDQNDASADPLEELDSDFSLDDLVQEMAEAGAVIGVPTQGELENAEAMAALVQLLGQCASGEDRTPQQELDQALALASQIDFGVFKDLFGRTARVVRGASRKAETARGEMVGYKADTWSDRVIATDMLAVAQGQMDAMVRLAEGQLQTRKYEGEETQGKGPVVVLRDETGSMRYSHQHAPALSLEVALADAFNRDGRDLVSVAWATPGTGTRTYTWGESAVEYDKHGRKSTTNGGVQEHLRSFLKGGDTLLKTGLVKALDVAEEYVPGADILIITDGHLSDSEDLATDYALKGKLDSFRDDGGRIWVIILGDLDEGEWRESLPIADGYVSIDRIHAGDALDSVLSSMADRSDKSSLSRRFIA